MSEETLLHAFEPFFTTKAAGRGTGLGLSTCQAVVTRSGGTIEAQSVAARGTTFVIRLPRALGEQRPDVEVRATAPRAGGREMILLVEDDPQVRSLTARLLRGWGYRVLPAADPADAVRMAAEHPGELDLILSDIVMPGQSGPELVSGLASTQPHARTLFVSGYPGDEMETFGLTDGALPILAKPYAPDELALRVRQLLDAPR
jgi:CheY-like chemotaxis protein